VPDFGGLRDVRFSPKTEIPIIAIGIVGSVNEHF
jgi:hypothetical protein